MPDTFLALFFWLFPLLKCVLQDQTPFQKAFYLNFPAYMTSLCTLFTLNTCWPVTALVWWDDCYLCFLEGIYHLTQWRCLILPYRGFAFVCVCHRVSLAKCDAYSGHSLSVSHPGNTRPQRKHVIDLCRSSPGEGLISLFCLFSGDCSVRSRVTGSEAPCSQPSLRTLC